MATVTNKCPSSLYHQNECHAPKKTVKAGETPQLPDARHRADFLKACRTEIIALPHQKFVDLWRQKFQPWLSQLPAVKGREMADALCKERESYEKRFSVVVCTEVGSPTKLPQLSMRTRVPIGAERLPDGTIYLTREAREQYEAMKKAPLKLEEYENLSEQMLGFTDLFPSKATPGNLAATMIKTDLFLLCGVPKENLSHRYICLPSKDRVHFHCTTRVRTEYVYQHIVDKTFESGNRQHCVSTILCDPATKVIENIATSGMQVSFAIENIDASSFVIPPNMILKKLEGKEASIGPRTEQECDAAGKRLAKDRVQIERELLLQAKA